MDTNLIVEILDEVVFFEAQGGDRRIFRSALSIYYRQYVGVLYKNCRLSGKTYG